MRPKLEFLAFLSVSVFADGDSREEAGDNMESSGGRCNMEVSFHNHLQLLHQTRTSSLSPMWWNSALEWGPLIRRHSPTEIRRSTGARRQSRTQVDLRKPVRTVLAYTSPSEPQTPSDSPSATSERKPPLKLCVQAEVYTGQPWPPAALKENMISSAWSLALHQRKPEKEEYYRSQE
ncbi:hypothetical protein HOY80DRAFT_1000894 [Tuber brumale]|nr:hypothetical protein HOY80DRAFT_1000894 [Tuber brumale]